jgi:hypothetical protein
LELAKLAELAAVAVAVVARSAAVVAQAADWLAHLALPELPAGRPVVVAGRGVSTPQLARS